MLAALCITALAGLSTGVGGLLALCVPVGPRLLAAAMGFAGGVMLTVSLADLLPAALIYYQGYLPPLSAGLAAVSLLCMGMVVAALLDRCIPETAGQALAARPDRQAAFRRALVVGMALVLHNLPEGILTLFSGVADPRQGLRVALAIALHNLPEGVAVAAPLYYATGRRGQALAAALGSGLAEPLGALAAWLVLYRFLTPAFLNGLLVLVAGVMIWVAAAQLLPAAFEGRRRDGALGLAGGVLCMLLGIAALA